MDPNRLLEWLYAFIIVATSFVFWHRRRFNTLSRQFPGPIEMPFIGVFHRVMQPRDMLPLMKWAAEVYETQTIFTYFGPQPVLYTTNPDLLRPILSMTELQSKPQFLYEPLSYLLGDGLLTISFTPWQQHRKYLNPCFRTSVLRTFVPLFNKSTKHFQKKLDLMVGQGEQQLHELFEKLTLTTGLETIFGRKMDNGAEADDSIVRHYSSVLKSTVSIIILRAVKLGGLVKHFNFYKSRNAVFVFLDQILQERIDTIKNGDNNNEKVNILKTEIDYEDLFMNDSRRIYIDQLLKQYELGRFSWEEVVNEVRTIIFGAFETSASTIYFTLVFLAMHPDVQDKLFEEIKSVFPDKNADVEYEHTQQCPYLDMVVNETLRVAPSVPIIARAAMRDTQLTDDIMLPKDLVVLINIFQVHRNRKIWGPNAEKFDPDNFLLEKVKQRHDFGYIPFAKGIRNCIGGRYALLSVKVTLLRILRTFRFTTKFKYEDLEFINYISLRLDKYPLLEIHRRE